MQHAGSRGLTGEAEDSLGPGVEGDADDEEDDQDEDDHADHRAGPEGLCNGKRVTLVVMSTRGHGMHRRLA